MPETRVADPKPHPSGLGTMRKVTRRRCNYGFIMNYGVGSTRPGTVVYWARRRTDEFFHKDGSWAVDVDTIAAVKPYGVKFIGIEVEDGTRLLAPIDIFGPKGKDLGVYVLNYSQRVGPSGKTGALQFYVPERLWAKKLPPQPVRQANMLKQVAISSRAK
jgi:hypothetical protein